MEILLNTANPWIALMYTLFTVLVIYLARSFKLPILPGAMIIVNILLLILHSTGLETLIETAKISNTYLCIAFDLIMLLLNFICYLWIDEIVSKERNLKSYDDSLSWFWNKL